MKKLNDKETEEIIEIAYNTAYNTIIEKMNKKDFEDINISIKIDNLENGFDIDIDINLDSDLLLDENLSTKAIDNSLKAIDEYIEQRNAKLDE